MGTRTLDQLTVGDLRRLVHSGDEADTLEEALAKFAQADQASSEHDAVFGAYQAYVGLREQRQRHALDEAAQQAQEETRGRGDGERMAARRQARTDAYGDFQQREPLLDFPAWQEAGQPETHTVGAVRRAAAAVRELVQ